MDVPDSIKAIQNLLDLSPDELADIADQTGLKILKASLDQQKEITALKKRLSELEEDCPDCEGKGIKPVKQLMPIHRECPTCQGSGKVPICYLPDSFMANFRMMAISHLGKIDKDILNVTKGKVVFAEHVIIEQPNNLWKLSIKIQE